MRLQKACVTSTGRWWIDVTVSRCVLCMAGVCLLLTACGDSSVDHVIEDGLDGVDQDLVSFIQGKIDAVRAQKQSSRRRGQLGMAYEANGFHDAAEATYQQAMDLDTSDFRWPYFRAVTLIKLVRLEEALDDLNRALAIDPTYVPAMLVKGELLLDLDRFREAGDVYRQVIELARDQDALAAAKIGQARALLRQDDPGTAAALLNELALQYPHPHVIRLYNTAKRRLGQPVSTSPVASAAVSWPDPRQKQKREYLRGAMGRLLAAEKLMEAGRHDQAIELLEPLVAAAPDDVDLSNNLAAAYLAADRTEEARELLERGLVIDPDVYQSHYNLASVYRGQGEFEQALYHTEQALQLMPTLSVAHRDRIDLLVTLDRSGEEVRRAMEEAEQVGAADSDTLYYLGLYFGAREDWQSTIDYLTRVVDLEPDRGKAHLYLAHGLMNVGLWDASEQALLTAARNGISTEAAISELEQLRSKAAQAR